MSPDTQDKIESLESQLLDKEELIVALTERLEQAAEQLDRYHRTGADRGTRVAGGIPAELVERQLLLTEELQQAVERWEQMQAEAALERLESQISELRDLMDGRGTPGRPLIPSAPHYERQSSADEEEIRSTENEAIEGPAENSADGYEAMKAAILGADDESPPAKLESYSSVEIQDELQKIEPIDPPQDVDLSAADLDELRRAVEERDSYIGWLIKRLRVFESCRRLPESWEALNNAPEEMQRRLESLENQLQATLRLAEVEHSLERARLSREETRIKHVEQQLQREIRRLGLEHAFPGEFLDAELHGLHEDASELAEDSNTERGKGPGWLSFLSGRVQRSETSDQASDGPSDPQPDL